MCTWQAAHCAHWGFPGEGPGNSTAGSKKRKSTNKEANKGKSKKKKPNTSGKTASKRSKGSGSGTLDSFVVSTPNVVSSRQQVHEAGPAVDTFQVGQWVRFKHAVDKSGGDSPVGFLKHELARVTACVKENGTVRVTVKAPHVHPLCVARQRRQVMGLASAQPQDALSETGGANDAPGNVAATQELDCEPNDAATQELDCEPLDPGTL